MAYQRFIVNGKKMAKKKKSKRTSSRRSTKASRSTAAKKAARTRATKKAARSRAAKKGARTRAKKSPKRRNPAKKATKKVAKKRNVKKATKKVAKKRNKSPSDTWSVNYGSNKYQFLWNRGDHVLFVAPPRKAWEKTMMRPRTLAAAKKTSKTLFAVEGVRGVTKRNKKKPSAAQLAARAKFGAAAKARAAKARAKKTTIPESMKEALGSTKTKRRKPVAGFSKGGVVSVSGGWTAAGFRKAQETAFKEMAAAEKACDAALAKTNKELTITKAELDKVKSRLKKAESAIKAFERTIGRLEAPARAQAKKSLARLKTRQRETAKIVKRTIQYYNHLGSRRVRTGGKTWVKSPKTRAKRCPPSKTAVKRSARAVRKGEPSGKAMADKRWCAGVKRNFWNMNEDLL